MVRQIKLIGSAISQCGRVAGCELAPNLIAQELTRTNLITESEIYTYSGTNAEVDKLKDYFDLVAKNAAQQNLLTKFPLFIGGDHSCAIGAWSGIAENLRKNNHELGLIWVDAHMDAHRPDTSPSGNVHGMPVAHLLGHGHVELISLLGNNNPKLKPENLVYFGVRSFEEPEEQLLKNLGVKIYYQDMLNAQNFTELFLAEYEHLAKQTNGNVGISLDLDALDPKEIVAVGVPEKDGIPTQVFRHAMEQLDVSKLVAFEVAEYNPLLDQQQKSFNYTMQILHNLITKVISND